MDRRRRIAAGLVALTVAAAAVVTSPAALLSRLAWIAADPVRFGLALVALALVRPALAWPSTLITLAAGYGYGVAGVPVALALLVVTSLPPYVAARRFVAGGEGDGRIAAAGERLVDAAGDVRSVVASRFLPAPSDLVSVGAGVAGVPLRPYLLGTAVGETPWAVAGVLVGASADALTADGLAAAADPRLLALAALAGVALCVGPAYRRFAGSSDGEAEPGSRAETVTEVDDRARRDGVESE